MKLKRKFREIRKNPVYVKSGIFLLLSLLLFLCVYIQDNSRSILTDEKGQEIVKRSDDAGKKENLELKVKAGDLEESVNITVSGRAYDSVELEEKFKEAAENLEKIILGDNENPDEVRTDLNLVTEIPDTGISVTWELDNYDVMDIRGGLRQENLTEEGTLVKLTALLRYEEETASHEFYVRVYPPRLSESEKILQEISEEVRQMDEETRTQDYLPLPGRVNGIEIQW